MKAFTVVGSNQYTICEINNDVQPIGLMSAHIDVEEGVYAIAAAICDPVNGNQTDGSKVQMTVTGPDGTVYNQALNLADKFVRISGAAADTLYILQPAAGRWSITCKCTVSTTYRANLFTIPSQDQIDSVLSSLEIYYPGDKTLPSEQLHYELFYWSYLTLAAVLAAMRATPGLAMDLSPLIMHSFEVTADFASKIISLINGQTVDGTLTTFFQQAQITTPLCMKSILVNGAASDQLQGWTIIASGGAGWTTQIGYAEPIEYDHNFAVSNGWCKKSQLIDLTSSGGLTGEYLDLAPPLTITDWVAATYPAGATTPSQYYLLVELRDAQQRVIKRFQTGNVALPIYQGDLRWSRFVTTFNNYGAGVRYVYFEHGGLDAQPYTSPYGLKITGAAAGVSLGLPFVNPPELIKNGSAQNGLTGWDIIGTNVWTADNGPGINCPSSPGSNAFSVTSGTGKKSQLIDLVAAGYSPQTLDMGPLIQMSQWICAEANTPSSYNIVMELRDAQQNVLLHYDSGLINIPSSLAAATIFVRHAQSWINYGAGLRYIYFEHSATTSPGMASAKLTGTSIKIVSEGENLQFRNEITRLEAAAPPAPIVDTTIAPYKWICFLEMTYFNANYVGSGWQIPQPQAGKFAVMTAAHCIRDRDVGWPRNMNVTPAAGNQAGNPYQSVDVPRGKLQIPINWLIKNQAQPTDGALYDYGLIYVDTPANWDIGGFTPTAENDGQLQNQSATITAFPAAPPYTQGKMYTEDIKIRPWNKTQVTVPTYFTGGSSGGPIYVKGTSNAVSIQSYGYSNWPASSILSNGTTRINADVLADIARWSTPLKATDPVNKLQMVIRTGMDWGAGTDDNITCSIDGQTYDLEKLWFGGAPWYRSRNEAGDFDGYDLTPRLKAIYPNGIKIQDLLTKTYTISRVIPFFLYHSWMNGDWEVESVAIFVNDQLMCAQNFYKWITIAGIAGDESITGRFTLG